MFTPFCDMCFRSFAPRVAVFFCNLSIPKLFHRENSIHSTTFCACLFDLISIVVFDNIFLDLWCCSGFHSASFFFHKQMVPNMLQKKWPARLEQFPIQMLGDSRRDRLACALLKRDATARTQKVVWFFPMYFCLPQMNAMEFFKNLSKDIKRINGKSTLLMIWHALGLGLANCCNRLQPLLTSFYLHTAYYSLIYKLVT